MFEVDITKVSSKGQVVIPGDIRKSLDLQEGEKLLVWADHRTIVLKKVGRPSPAEIERLFQAGSRFAKAVGLKKSDVKKVIREVRTHRKS